MAARIPKGSASAKSSGTTLTISNVTVPEGHCLVVGVGCDNGAGAPATVTHNGRSLRRKVQRDNTTDAIHASAWLKGGYLREQTGPIVATWSSAIVERAMVASSFDFTAVEDQDGSREETTATTSPLSGATIALEGDPPVAICFFVSEGPESDHGSATADIQDGTVWTAATIGQKEGTVGAPPASNVTVTETWLQLTAQDLTRGRLQSATSREWANVILVLKERVPLNRQGISPTDIAEVEQVVADAGGNPDDVYFGLDETTGEWVAYETSTPGTLRATRDNDTGEWI